MTNEEILHRLKIDASFAWPEVVIVWESATKLVTYIVPLSPTSKVSFMLWLDDWFRAFSAAMPVQVERRRVSSITEKFAANPREGIVEEMASVSVVEEVADATPASYSEEEFRRLYLNAPSSPNTNGVYESEHDSNGNA